MTTPLGEKMLSVFDSDEWITRRQLAVRMGRRVISPYDLQVLEKLIAEGLVEEKTRPLGLVRTEYIYRSLVKQGEGQ